MERPIAGVSFGLGRSASTCVISEHYAESLSWLGVSRLGHSAAAWNTLRGEIMIAFKKQKETTWPPPDTEHVS